MELKHTGWWPVNICNDGGSVIAFKDSQELAYEPQADRRETVDTEWLDYCRARELAERAAAKRACSMEARSVHQELAQAYARITQGMTNS